MPNDPQSKVQLQVQVPHQEAIDTLQRKLDETEKAGEAIRQKNETLLAVAKKVDDLQAQLAQAEVRAADAERSRVWAETQATKALARADAAEARVKDEAARADLATENFRLTHLEVLGWLHPKEAAKLRSERDFAVDKCRVVIAREERGVRSTRPSAEQLKLEDGVEEAIERLDGVAEEIATMRKRLKGSLE